MENPLWRPPMGEAERRRIKYLCKIQTPHLHLQFELLSGYNRHPVVLCCHSWCWCYCTDSPQSLHPLHVQCHWEHSLRGCSGLHLHSRRFVCHKYNPCWPRTPSSMPALGQMLAHRLSLPEPWADTQWQSPHYFCSGDAVEQLFSPASCSSSEHNVLVERRTWPLSHLNKSPINKYWLP